MAAKLPVPHLYDAALIPLPEDGTHWIDQPLFEQKLTAFRTCVNRQQPFGTHLSDNNGSRRPWDLNPPYAAVAARRK